MRTGEKEGGKEEGESEEAVGRNEMRAELSSESVGTCQKAIYSFPTMFPSIPVSFRASLLLRSSECCIYNSNRFKIAIPCWWKITFEDVWPSVFLVTCIADNSALETV